jgi:uroporphyrin-III C-methyltransferase/precorrin-2 dehydrogenase/sirohydrochlorin ferrochelatase
MGAGPGAPELLTAQAVSILRTSEVVLHDDDVASEILDLIPASTQVRNVHKLGAEPEHLQEKIHSLLVSAAREGHQVVRLMATDPTQSVLAGELTEPLTQAGVAFELIPASAVAVGAAAGANSR